MYKAKSTAMKGNLTALIVLLLVQLLLWKSSAIRFYTVNKNPHSSTAQKDSSPQETVKVSNTRLQTTLKGHALKVSSVAITADNKTVISGSADNTIKIWDSQTGKLERTITGHTGVVNYLSVTPDGKYIVSAEDKNARIWHRQTGKLIREIINSNNKVYLIETSQDGKTLVVDGDIQTIKKTIIVDSSGYKYPKESEITKYILNVFNLQTGTLKSQLIHDNPLTKIVVSKSSNILVSGDETGKLNIWNLKNGTFQKSLTGHKSAIKSIAISRDEKTIVSTEKAGQIKIWDLDSEKLKSTFTGHELNNEEFVEVLIPDNNILISWNVIKSSLYKNNNVIIWNLQTGELRNTIEPPKNKDLYLDRYFDLVKVSPDGKNLITTGILGTHIWELATGQLKDTIAIEKDILAFSPDGNILATSGDANIINIWQIPFGDKY